jgi:hypothetical protein
MGVAVVERRARDRARIRSLTPSELVWLGVVPAALLTLLAIALVGPEVGRALLAPSGERIFPGVSVLPEPVEQGRFLVALTGPLLLIAFVAATEGRLRAHPTTTRALVAAGQVATVAFLTACVLAQQGAIPGAVLEPWSPPNRYFTPASWATAAACALLLVAAIRARSVIARLSSLAGETPRRRAMCMLAAVVFTAVWLLRSVNFDGTFGNEDLLNRVPWEMSDAFAVLDGRSPLVDFHAVYNHLGAYLVAAVMSVTGASAATWTLTMVSISALGSLAVLDLLRRVVRSAPLALMLYVPFVAISCWVVGSPREGTSFSSLFGVWPLRYGWAYLLAWLTARHLDGGSPRRTWLLFLAAGLVLINNPDFGLGAFAGTLAATAIDPRRRSPRMLVRLAAAAAAGLAAACALVSLLTLARAGQLPNPAFALEFSRLFVTEGWGLEPMPAIGLHLVLYATFAAAIVASAVLARNRGNEALLASMLAWAGAFGMLASTYYVGRSNPGNLMALFSAWSLALALLLVVVVRALIAQRRRPTLPEACVLLGFSLGVASLPNVPIPWAEITRLQHHAAPLYAQPQATAFVAERAAAGERVAILAPLGFRIAYDAGVVNVSPYPNLEAVRSPRLVRTLLAAIERMHVHRIFIKQEGIGEESGNLPDVRRALERAGFSAPDRGERTLVELTDAQSAAG